MKIQGSVSFAASPERIWEALLDPHIMAQCIPGCQQLEEVAADVYRAHIRVGVGAVSGSYTGRLNLVERHELTRYAMTFEGSGSQGFVSGTGAATLRPEAGGTTVLYDCEVEVGGLIASVGQRVLHGVSRFLIGQMFTKLGKLVQVEEPIETSIV